MASRDTLASRDRRSVYSPVELEHELEQSLLAKKYVREVSSSSDQTAYRNITSRKRKTLHETLQSSVESLPELTVEVVQGRRDDDESEEFYTRLEESLISNLWQFQRSPSFFRQRKASREVPLDSEARESTSKRPIYYGAHESLMASRDTLASRDRRSVYSPVELEHELEQSLLAKKYVREVSSSFNQTAYRNITSRKRKSTRRGSSSESD
ncbi:uncharacterized protein LOC126978709 [Leptidea sinapis]|uniref:uncharacterized protein LOC126978709 n=1 Tax=Leptidea sinapis TaxID=189913 RepID=UPI0021C498BD|nr:uncharacterized protein LOC126978709 [Leptidea sinapis]